MLEVATICVQTGLNILLFKFRCNIFIGVRIIKEMPGSVASGTPCIYVNRLYVSMTNQKGTKELLILEEANCFLCNYKTDEINNISDFNFKCM